MSETTKQPSDSPLASPPYSALVSVDERLPDANAQVIVRHKHGVNEAECWRGNSGRKKTATWDAPYYGQVLSHSFEGVTHWMPMPIFSQNAKAHTPRHGEPQMEEGNVYSGLNIRDIKAWFNEQII